MAVGNHWRERETYAMRGRGFTTVRTPREAHVKLKPLEMTTLVRPSPSGSAAGNGSSAA